MITAKITHDTENRTTTLTGVDIDEIMSKVKDYHTLGEFELRYFDSLGTLIHEINSGWYLKEEVCKQEEHH